MIEKLEYKLKGMQVLNRMYGNTELLFVDQDFSLQFWAGSNGYQYYGLYDENEFFSEIDGIEDIFDLCTSETRIPELEKQTGARYVFGWDM